MVFPRGGQEINSCPPFAQMLKFDSTQHRATSQKRIFSPNYSQAEKLLIENFHRAKNFCRVTLTS
jgi:hypothetical protein